MENAMTYHEITPFLHASMVLFVIVLAIFISIAGARLKRTGHLQPFSKGFGISLLGLWIAYNIYYFLPANFKLDTSLPLHVCDFMAIIASISLIKPNKRTSALLYFCALALTSQAIITPTGNQDPTTFRFWLFWFLHGGIISAAIYDLVVRSYRPVFKDYLFVVGCDLLYVALILPLDIIFGWNYGFIGNIKPDTPTIIDALGPWPQRLIWMVGLVVIVQFIMYLPWKWRKH
ncbi:TIGR02206 family membrane protein [Bacteroides sp. 51]|uniref:YwaF family protein n=1 Tax=Bacteroides sp. 51 TaxID=2302938 RepID=UPI0013CFC77D|nr:TIGR02206 family membrane protein [Bacteroides sp. 51]NDV82720.1 TIGR02206 family membrane protein [Bacteroides sp. 51]